MVFGPTPLSMVTGVSARLDEDLATGAGYERPASATSGYEWARGRRVLYGRQWRGEMLLRSRARALRETRWSRTMPNHRRTTAALSREGHPRPHRGQK